MPVPFTKGIANVLEDFCRTNVLGNEMISPTPSRDNQSISISVVLSCVVGFDFELFATSHFTFMRTWKAKGGTIYPHHAFVYSKRNNNSVVNISQQNPICMHDIVPFLVLM